MAVGIAAEHPRTERAGDEPRPERGERGEQAVYRVGRGKERLPDLHRENAEDEEIVELERVARGNRADLRPGGGGPRCVSHMVASFEGIATARPPRITIITPTSPIASAAARYHAGATGLPVQSSNRLITGCVLPPNTAIATA